jgi:hypothetical protein
MPILAIPRHEQFAALIAGGMAPAKAYSGAGFGGKGAAQSASRLAKRAPVAARIVELSKNLSCMAVQRAVIDRDFVLNGLKEIATNKAEKKKHRGARPCLRTARQGTRDVPRSAECYAELGRRPGEADQRTARDAYEGDREEGFR